MSRSQESKEVEAYISAFPAEVQEKLQQLSGIIRQTAPDAKEGQGGVFH